MYSLGTVIKVQNLCRICFQEGKIDLFSDDKESKQALSTMQECFDVTLLYEKCKPSAICEDCLNELNRTCIFRAKCLTIDERFRNYYRGIAENTENAPRDKCDIHEAICSQEYNIDTDIDYFESPIDTNLNVTDVPKTIDDIKDIEDGSNFKCDICKKILKTKKSLLKHYISMHKKRKHIGKVSGFGTSRRYHCSSCPYSTPHSQTLVNHMRRHNGERPYSCECGKSFTQSSSLAAHSKTHSTVTYFTCVLCGKQFKHAFTMKNHLRVHENGNFSCNICRKMLKSKQSLQAHIRRHYNICDYNCEECGDTFVTSSELVNHRKKHSLEKKFECHLCGYKTHTKKNLIIHLKRHTGNRSFKCNRCHVGFYTQSNLQRHQRVHTRDKPFTCPTCSQKFTYSPSLNKHMKNIHGVDYKWGDYKWKQNKIVKVTDDK